MGTKWVNGERTELRGTPARLAQHPAAASPRRPRMPSVRRRNEESLLTIGGCQTEWLVTTATQPLKHWNGLKRLNQGPRIFSGGALRRAKSRPPQSILVNSIYPSQILGWNLLILRIKAESGLLWHFRRPLGHGMNQGIGPDSWTHDEN